MGDRPLSPIRSFALVIAATIALDGSVAYGQSTPRAIFEKYGLIGQFAVDCRQAVSRSNTYFVNRVVDGDRIQRDRMSSPSARDFISIIASARELRPNEIFISGTRDGTPGTAIWRLERLRQIAIEVVSGGKPEISRGRLLSNGAQVPWLNRCWPRP